MEFPHGKIAPGKIAPVKTVILMAGDAKRFNNTEFTEIKPLIKVNGKEIVKWTTDSIPNLTSLTFAVRTEHNVKDRLKNIYGPDVKFVEFEKITRGNLETAYLSCNGDKNQFNDILFLDSDNKYDGKELLRFIDKIKEETDEHFAVICYFEPLDNSSKWCFAHPDKDGRFCEKNRIVDIAEKDPLALEVGGKPMVGVFYFSSIEFFLRIAEEELITNQSEYYMSGAIRQCLQQRIQVYGLKVNGVVPLGTPEDARKFQSSKKLRVCFDLDKTICEEKKSGQSYADVAPIPEMVDFIKALKRDGHTVILHTARNMVTFSGNLGLITAKQAPVVFVWLKKYNIEFDEIYFGKPHADAFIDDKAIHFDNNIEEVRRQVYNLL